MNKDNNINNNNINKNNNINNNTQIKGKKEGNQVEKVNVAVNTSSNNSKKKDSIQINLKLNNSNSIKNKENEKNEEIKIKNENELSKINQNDNDVIILLKNELKKKEDEILKITKMNVTLRKNLEKLSNQLNVYVKKALEDNKKKKNKNEKAQNNSINEEYKEKIEIKDKQINNSLAMINYLKRDNQKLKDTIEILKNSSTSNLNELIQSKEMK